MLELQSLLRKIDTKEGTAGGGEVLKVLEEGTKPSVSYLDDQLISMFEMLPWMKYAIFVMFAVIIVLILMRLYGVRSITGYRGIEQETVFSKAMRKRDMKIIRINRWIQLAVKIVSMTPFNLSVSAIENLNYNLNRARINIPGGTRIMKAEEFNAAQQMLVAITAAFMLLVGIVTNLSIGILLAVGVILLGNMLPMIFIRSIVEAKDEEIMRNFSDFYLMIHYSIRSGGSTPIPVILKSFQATTDSSEMIRLADTCIYCMETYGEHQGTLKIAEEYKEIHQVGKLMRLIRQSLGGGNVLKELDGFRQELLEAKEYALTIRMEKIVKKAKLAFNILMPILVQAILSAMAIYMEDLGAGSSILGGF